MTAEKKDERTELEREVWDEFSARPPDYPAVEYDPRVWLDDVTLEGLRKVMRLLKRKVEEGTWP